jgi:transposase|tara:strand:+ start:105 stop:563 length:459 start_codon:yes stop_codon:yes gene_type:complete
MLSTKERKLILQWNHNGKTQQEIADLLGCNQSAVSRLLQKYKRKKTVANLPRSGRPTKLNKEVLSGLRDRITNLIQKANKSFCAVSTKQVAQVIEQEVGKSYSHRHVERLLHKMKFSLVTPRPQHIRHDQKKVDAFREEFKKKLRSSMWTTS